MFRRVKPGEIAPMDLQTDGAAGTDRGEFRLRGLTASERKLLPEAMARDIDLDEVRIHRRWHSPVAAILKVTIVRGARIFWKNAPAEATTIAERAHLAHELVHVWQYRALRRTGPELLASRLYRYALDPARSFLSYGYEQQAAIVEDAFLLSQGASPRWAKSPAAIEAYNALIAGARASDVAPFRP